MFRYFQTIRTSTADYIAYINSEQTDQRMQTEAFLVYKNQFTTYLRDFIVSLQNTALQIRERLDELSPDRMALFFEKLVEHRQSIPRLEDVSSSVEEWRTEYLEYWGSLRQWFLGSNLQQSELDILQWQTNEMIRRMTRYVQRIGERQQHFRSRKNDYLHLAKWFVDTDTLEEAHKLSSVVFGTMTIKHLQLDEVSTDNLHTETWEENPVMIPLKPRTNRYREKTKPGSMVSNEEKKRLQREQYLAERKQEQVLIEKYIDEGVIKLSAVSKVEPFVRKVLLGWIGKSMASKNGKVKTDYGMVVKVSIDREKTVLLDAEDGTLKMPDALFTFEGEGESK
ncbi:TIGR02677 family protein [Bacillus sp. ISL-55]|uniref:TIGR02677 family protein n=1 Tax=Bacillus sp. ISL-55 TaxID=2819134 RepID=UPI001BE73D63|nr:TIGR02677 family protein [Bacillus sp. ISL-55]